MAWSGQASPEEMRAVLTAINALENSPHISHMSYNTVAVSAGIKATAVRWIIPELIKNVYIVQLSVGKQKVPRYFYQLTDSGKSFMTKEATE